MRRVPDNPRTRVEEILRARGLTQAEVVERTGWYQSTISNIVIGKSQLTAHSSGVLSRLCRCDVSEFYVPIGSAIPPSNTQRASMDLDTLLAARVSVVLRLLDVPSVSAMTRFLMAGDLSALPPHTARRFKLELDEELRLTNSVGSDEDAPPPVPPPRKRRRVG